MSIEKELQDAKDEIEQLKTDNLLLANDRSDCYDTEQKLIIEIEGFRKAYNIAYQATYQGHSTHWDSKGTSGVNCPACISARESRLQCDNIIKEIL